jgi:hypothetical protein
MMNYLQITNPKRIAKGTIPDIKKAHPAGG